ncbi:Hypothetical protein FKW44_011760, partial [Caligus rogercresseyi]
LKSRSLDRNKALQKTLHNSNNYTNKMNAFIAWSSRIEPRLNQIEAELSQDSNRPSNDLKNKFAVSRS